MPSMQWTGIIWKPRDWWVGFKLFLIISNFHEIAKQIKCVYVFVYILAISKTYYSRLCFHLTQRKKGVWSTSDADCGIDVISVISNESMVKEENNTPPVPAKERFSTLHNSNMYRNFEPVVSSDDENCIEITSNEWSSINHFNEFQFI